MNRRKTNRHRLTTAPGVQVAGSLRSRPSTKGHQTTVDFVIYTEASAAKAKQTFDQAAAFIKDKAKPTPSGLGDEAYWGLTDDEPAMLHVLKGKSHYSLELEPANDSKLLELAAAVSARI
jgi:hypothetical protein